MTGLVGGGNKVRKIEHLAADALVLGATVLLTIGGLQSNQALQTAATAARLGLECELVLEDAVDWSSTDDQYSGNVLLDEILGAHIHRAGREKSLDEPVKRNLSEIRQRGDKPYDIPVGGSARAGTSKLFSRSPDSSQFTRSPGQSTSFPRAAPERTRESLRA